MTDQSVFPVPLEVAAAAWCDNAKYLELYQRSVDDPEGFWGEEGKRIHWFKPYSQVKDVSYGPGDVHIKWYHDGTTNAAYSCIDRHLPAKKDDTAIIWEGDDPADDKHITYGELYENVGRLANAIHADDPRGGLRHAGLRAHRRDPLGGVRRLLARRPGRPHHRLRLRTA